MYWYKIAPILGQILAQRFVFGQVLSRMTCCRHQIAPGFERFHHIYWKEQSWALF